MSHLFLRPPVDVVVIADGPYVLAGSGTVTIGDYAPKNSTAANGVMDMRRAAAGSVNTYFLQLEKTIGLCPVVKMAKKLGVKRADGQKLSEVETFTLGVNEVDPINAAYTGFVSDIMVSQINREILTRLIEEGYEALA
jgi:membrane carboxypeptidase/penicillin-binding protein